MCLGSMGSAYNVSIFLIPISYIPSEAFDVFVLTRSQFKEMGADFTSEHKSSQAKIYEGNPVADSSAE